MSPLTPGERFQLEAAEGWLMLGNAVEAHEELEKLPGDANHHPAVLRMRWQVYAAAGLWEVLMGVAPEFPDNAVVQYNLACYAAQMGLLEESCGWLVKAFEIEESAQLKLAALCDPDLRPLWEKIGRDRVEGVTGQKLVPMKG